MSDTYQAIYDAVRSRISNGDIGSAVESAIRDAGISHYANMAAESIRVLASEYERPSVIFKPRIFPDGNQWCCLYGENIQEGIVGWGETPAKAAYQFDAEWFRAKAV